LKSIIFPLLHTSHRFASSAKLVKIMMLTLLMFSIFHAKALAEGGHTTVSADTALARLKSGNQRFVKGKPQVRHLISERKALAEGQAPYAIILCCSDSRVSPEIIFDESLGKLFVVRVAGNVADPVDLGSIEYAAQHLHAKLLLVVGHESCGAVKATLDGGQLPANIEAIVEKISPAVIKAKRQNRDTKTTLNVAIEENVRQQMNNALQQSAVLREMVEKKELRIDGGVYNLHTGKVEYLSAESRQ
jgi:carbonic anhydrase